MSDANDQLTVEISQMSRDAAAYLSMVEAGKKLLLVKGGKPLAEITPFVAADPSQRPFGLAIGEFNVPDDFDEPLPSDILDAFEGK